MGLRGPPKGTRIGGRQKGTPNKITNDIRAMAQVHGPAALATLVELMNHGEMEGTRRAAASDLLDRGYGKAPQAMTGEGGAGPVKHEVTVQIVGPKNHD